MTFPNDQSKAAGAIPVWLGNQSGAPQLMNVGSGGKLLPNFIGDNYVAITLNSASGTTPQLVYTGAPGYFVTRLLVEVDPTVTQTTGGIITVNFTDSVFGNIGQYRVYVPTSAATPTVPTGQILVASGTGYFWRSLNTGSTLSVSLSAALTAGSIRCAVNGGITPIY